jgi:ankyrin repeat protein
VEATGGLTLGCGFAVSRGMVGIWKAAEAGDVSEVERLVEQAPGLLGAKGDFGMTPLVSASSRGHVGVVRWLVEKGVSINEPDETGATALWFASSSGQSPVVRLLLERGADPTIATEWGSIPLHIASVQGAVDVVRLLLGHASAEATINQRDLAGQTALWLACQEGRGGGVRALLESGADFKIVNNFGISPLAIAKHRLVPQGITTAGHRECMAALEVRPHLLLLLSPSFSICCPGSAG